MWTALAHCSLRSPLERWNSYQSFCSTPNTTALDRFFACDQNFFSTKMVYCSSDHASQGFPKSVPSHLQSPPVAAAGWSSIAPFSSRRLPALRCSWWPGSTALAPGHMTHDPGENGGRWWKYSDYGVNYGKTRLIYMFIYSSGNLEGHLVGQKNRRWAGELIVWDRTVGPTGWSYMDGNSPKPASDLMTFPFCTPWTNWNSRSRPIPK